MKLDLVDTTAAQVGAALMEVRHQSGTPAVGMVMTLIIVTDEKQHYDALRAASESARQHPSRILVVVGRPGREAARLDAEVRFAGDASPGETVVLRMYGQLARHAESVVLPLLLPDAPVVTWWPGAAPPVPSEDPLGRLGQRRITDAAEATRSLQGLRQRAQAYQPGDTDLSWTRATPWRSLLAAALDQPYDEVRAAEVGAARGNPSAELLACWLERCLGVPVTRKTSRGPGITSAKLVLQKGEIAITRPDGRIAKLARPGSPVRIVALSRRPLPELLAEEMRRLDPDQIYFEALSRVGGGAQTPAQPVDDGQGTGTKGSTALDTPDPAARPARKRVAAPARGLAGRATRRAASARTGKGTARTAAVKKGLGTRSVRAKSRGASTGEQGSEPQDTGRSDDTGTGASPTEPPS
jgi:glucose-6-phosphate dehydrogenase assembly protein OpcA